MSGLVSAIFGSPSQPAAPDYAGAAKAQGQANLDAAIATGKLSNPQIYGPLGNQTVTYSKDNIPTITQTLTPNAQKTLDAQQRVQLALGNLGEKGVNTANTTFSSAFQPSVGGYQTKLDKSGIPQAPVAPGTTATQAMLARLEPTLARNEAATRQRLANQGLVAGGEAYTNEMTDQAQRRNDLELQAAAQGISIDQAAQNQAFNQATAQQGAENQANTAQFQRDLAVRQLPLNEITGLMGGSQIQMPQFQSFQGSQVAASPIFQAAQAQAANATNQYGIAQSGQNAMLGGLFDLGGAAIKASDRRLKSNIVQIGVHPLGIGIYEYDIFGHRDVGVMADEVENVMPEAIVEHPSGYKMVNYGLL